MRRASDKKTPPRMRRRFRAATAALPRGDFQLRPDMRGHFRRVEIDEVADAVEWYPAQLGPFAQGSDRRRLSLGKDAAISKANDVGQAVFSEQGELRLHARAGASTAADAWEE